MYVFRFSYFGVFSPFPTRSVSICTWNALDVHLELLPVVSKCFHLPVWFQGKGIAVRHPMTTLQWKLKYTGEKEEIHLQGTLLIWISTLMWGGGKLIKSSEWMRRSICCIFKWNNDILYLVLLFAFARISIKQNLPKKINQGKQISLYQSLIC